MTATTIPPAAEPAVRRSAPARAPSGNTFRSRMARRAPLLPALLFTIILTQLPFLYTVYISFLSCDRAHPEVGKNWAGLHNFRAVFTVDGVRSALCVTLELSPVVVVVCVLIGLGLSLLLD